MKKTGLFVLGVILSCQLNAQSTFLRGQVIGLPDSLPLAGAHVLSNGRNFGGTITNEEGRFSLRRTAGMDSLRISYLGYQQKVLPTHLFGEAPVLIQLEPEAIALKEAEVVAVPTEQLVRGAIRRLPLNHAPDAHIHSGFFRESIRDEDGYLSVAEALFEVAYHPEGRERLQLKLKRGRRSEDVRATRLFEDFHPAGGPHMLAGLNLALEPPTFLQEAYFEKYHYHLDTILRHHGRMVFVISFDQKQNIREALHQGKLYIEKESLAIVRLESGLSPSGMPYLKHLSGTDKLFAQLLKIDFQRRQSDIVAEYAHLDGYWHLHTARWLHGITYRQPKKGLNLELAIHEEVLFTGLIQKEAAPYARTEEWDSKQLMLSLPTQYEEAFWGEENHILPSRTLLDIVAGMQAAGMPSHSAADTLLGGWELADAARARAFQQGASIFLQPFMESEWMDEETGPLLRRKYYGNFQFQALVQVSKASDTIQAPDRGFQQGGLLVRHPSAERENYLLLSLGTAGNPKVKVGGNYTRHGRSSIKVDKVGEARLYLRIQRQGHHFRLSYRQPGENNWTLLREEVLPAFPAEVELGLIGYTHLPGHAPGMQPDLLVRFSEIDIQ